MMQTSDAAAGDDLTADQIQAEAKPLTLEDLEILDDKAAPTEIPEHPQAAQTSDAAEAGVPEAAEQPAEAEDPAAAADEAPAAPAEAAKPRNGFDKLGLDERVLRAIKSVGYETPSAIQEATIPVLLSGRDVVGLSLIHI